MEWPWASWLLRLGSLGPLQWQGHGSAGPVADGDGTSSWFLGNVLISVSFPVVLPGVGKELRGNALATMVDHSWSLQPTRLVQDRRRMKAHTATWTADTLQSAAASDAGWDVYVFTLPGKVLAWGQGLLGSPSGGVFPAWHRVPCLVAWSLGCCLPGVARGVVKSSGCPG